MVVIDPDEVARAKEEAELYKTKVLAAQYKAELDRIDPERRAAHEGGANSVASGAPFTFEQLKKDYWEAKRWKMWQETMGDKPSQGQITPKDILDKKSKMATQLAMARIPNEEIKKFMDDISPGLFDIPAFGQDQYSTMATFQRWQQSQQAPQRNDVLDAIRLGAELKTQPQQGTDVPALITAMGTFMQAMRQEQHSDPAAMFQAGMTAMQPLMNSMNENTKQLLQGQVEFYKTKISPEKSPVEYLREIRNLAADFGMTSTPESDEITSKRMSLEDAHKQREHDFEVKKYEMDRRAAEEAGKERRQSEILKNITGTLKQAFESPVIKEFGKSVGRSVGADKNPVIQAAAAAPAAAATAALANPTDVPWGFTCPQCKVPRTFTQKELALLEERGGNWVCPTPGCGTPYKLQPSGKKA